MKIEERIEHLLNLKSDLTEERRHRTELLEETRENAYKSFRFALIVGGLALTIVSWGPEKIGGLDPFSSRIIAMSLAFYLISLVSSLVALLPFNYFTNASREVSRRAKDPYQEQGVEALVEIIMEEANALESLDRYDFRQSFLLLISSISLFFSLLLTFGLFLNELSFRSTISFTLFLFPLLALIYVATRSQILYKFWKDKQYEENIHSK